MTSTNAAMANDVRVTPQGVANALSLAAAPTFALMALLTGLGGGHDMICAAASPMAGLGGMVLMYALMSVFHVSPWLRLAARRRSRRHGSHD